MFVVPTAIVNNSTSLRFHASRVSLLVVMFSIAAQRRKIIDMTPAEQDRLALLEQERFKISFLPRHFFAYGGDAFLQQFCSGVTLHCERPTFLYHDNCGEFCQGPEVGEKLNFCGPIFPDSTVWQIFTYNLWDVLCAILKRDAIRHRGYADVSITPQMIASEPMPSPVLPRFLTALRLGHVEEYIKSQYGTADVIFYGSPTAEIAYPMARCEVYQFIRFSSITRDVQDWIAGLARLALQMSSADQYPISCMAQSVTTANDMGVPEPLSIFNAVFEIALRWPAHSGTMFGGSLYGAPPCYDIDTGHCNYIVTSDDVDMYGLQVSDIKVLPPSFVSHPDMLYYFGFRASLFVYSGTDYVNSASHELRGFIAGYQMYPASYQWSRGQRILQWPIGVQRNGRALNVKTVKIRTSKKLGAKAKEKMVKRADARYVVQEPVDEDSEYWMDDDFLDNLTPELERYLFVVRIVACLGGSLVICENESAFWVLAHSLKHVLLSTLPAYLYPDHSDKDRLGNTYLFDKTTIGHGFHPFWQVNMHQYLNGLVRLLSFSLTTRGTSITASRLADIGIMRWTNDHTARPTYVTPLSDLISEYKSFTKYYSI